MDVFGTEAPPVSDGVLPPPSTLQRAQYAAPTTYTSPKVHRRHARGRLRKRNAAGVQSRQRFEMVRWLPDRPLLHRPGGVACVPAGKPPCWLLAASGCWGQIAGTEVGGHPPAQGQGPRRAPVSSVARQVWESPAAAAREPNRDRLQPVGARGVSDSTRPFLAARCRRRVCASVPGNVWNVLGHNGRQMAIQISTEAQSAVRNMYRALRTYEHRGTTPHGPRPTSGYLGGTGRNCLKLGAHHTHRTCTMYHRGMRAPDLIREGWWVPSSREQRSRYAAQGASTRPGQPKSCRQPRGT